jgi:hypothetical protein
VISARHAFLPKLAGITLACCVSIAATTNVHVVLPNPELLGCQSGACSQIWLTNDPAPDAKYPEQLRIDFSDGSPMGRAESLWGIPNGSPYGIIAIYDKSVTIEAVAASVNEHYAKWTYGDPDSKVKLWRVEPEKFVIQLACHKDEHGPWLIYLPLARKSPIDHKPK